ncbi:MAG: hypothetical protein R3F49_09130 [Planctomycetota bacterium]
MTPVLVRRGTIVAQTATQWGRVLPTTQAAVPVVRGRGPLQRTTRVRQLADPLKAAGVRPGGASPLAPGAPSSGARGRAAARPGAAVVRVKDFVEATLKTLPGLNGNPGAANAAGTQRISVEQARARGYDRVPSLKELGRKPSTSSPIYDSVPPLLSRGSSSSSMGTYSKLPPPLERLSSRVEPTTIPADVRARYAEVPPEVKANASPARPTRGGLMRVPRSRQLAADVARAKGAPSGSAAIPRR